MATDAIQVGIDNYEEKYGFHDREEYVFKSRRGLARDVVEDISRMKGEPDWMLQFRLKSLEYFDRRPMPQWGGNLNDIDFDNIYYYLKSSEKKGRTWEEMEARDAAANAAPRQRRQS